MFISKKQHQKELLDANSEWIKSELEIADLKQKNMELEREINKLLRENIELLKKQQAFIDHIEGKDKTKQAKKKVQKI